jgi:hypothetical protein
MGSKSSPAPQVVQTPQSSTTTQQLSPEQQEILNLAMPGIRNFAATTPERWNSPTVLGFNPTQEQGQNMVLGAASGNMQNVANTAAGANQFLMGDIWNPASNPHLQGAIDATLRPITEKYQQVVQPAIRDNFAAAGQQFGGSRQNIAQGMAARDYMRNIGDATSKLVQDQYGNNLNAMVKALALSPQTSQMQLGPGLATSAVGDVEQQLGQQKLDSAVAGYNYDQMAPYLQTRELLAMLQGVPGGTMSSSGFGSMVVPQQAQKSPLSGAMGGALAGGSLGSIIPGFGTGIGAGLGGLAGLLGFL